MHESMRQRPIRGEQQQPGGVHIESSDHDPATLRRRRQAIEHGRTPLGILTRGHLTYRLVIAEHDGRQCRARQRRADLKRATIEQHAIARRHSHAKFSHLPVHAHAPRADPLLDAATRPESKPREYLLQSFRHR